MGNNMGKVYIVGAGRSPIGKFLGELSDLNAIGIGAQVVGKTLDRSGIAPSEVEELILGNVLSSGLGQNPAKQVVMYSGMPDTTPAYSVNMVCASSLKAVDLASQSILSGDSDIVAAGGTESMSRTPFSIKGVRKFNRLGNIGLKQFVEKLNEQKIPASDFELVDEMINAGLWDCYSDLHMGALAEYIASDYKITREQQDAFAVESHRRAAEATDAGKFKHEITPIVNGDDQISTDEGIRRDTTMKKLAALKPAFRKDGSVTAGNSSQLSDGASFLILMSEKKVRESGTEPLAEIEAFSSSGIDPKYYGMAPVSAVKKLLKKTKLSIDDIDLVELNEAFSAQALGVIGALGIDKNKVNINGGAIALGHPIGATGARILTTLVYELLDRKRDTGLATLCHGGGGAAAMIIRRCDA